MMGAVKRLAFRLEARNSMLVVAESCTGGWLAQSCTAASGSSRWFERGFVTYSNQSKQDMLGVPEDLIATHGAVSEAVVRAMVGGAIARSRADVGVAISGIAGPTGGSPDKPVGTVWFAWAGPDGVTARGVRLFGDRGMVRRQAVMIALEGLLALLGDD